MGLAQLPECQLPERPIARKANCPKAQLPESPIARKPNCPKFPNCPKGQLPEKLLNVEKDMKLIRKLMSSYNT